ncbi:hypothetical protein CH275_12170 [Rhodococcus sp. 06-235-1A]|uniref:hypothetical protein n=1 Tax=Rhodococcus sp. 06-235-1A TaxID=2022508 RepID=UPI000B9BEEE1|nr:hypothetical protein [Rhodococcus sp. 06-235-1A]OZD05119.1 hypothetical protein CH275_12170 [Rhodococcus sp. 06-235-1A]
MRIRSIKPEFWRSEDVDALDWHSRLIFIGLWSYVDDSGVGRDDERLIRADLFPLTDDLTESSVRIHDALLSLHARGMITRYIVRGRRYLFITNWSAHQKINRPTKGRNPRPDDPDSTIHEPISESSVSPQCPELGNEGTREQGNKGAGPPSPPHETTAATGELVPDRGQADSKEPGSNGGDERTSGGRIAVVAPRSTAVVSLRTDADQIVVSYIKHMCPKGLIAERRASMTSIVGRLLTDGVTPDDVWGGIKLWDESPVCAHSQIPSFVQKFMNQTRTRATDQTHGLGNAGTKAAEIRSSKDSVRARLNLPPREATA